MKSTIIVVAMLLILATALLVIFFHEPTDLTGTRCTCPTPECPHVVKQAPQDGAQAEMYYLPYYEVAAQGKKHLVITTASLPGAQAGVAYSVQLTAAGGQQPYTWSVSQGTLPPGLTLSSSGLISGTPTAQGSYNFTIKVVDSSGQSAKADVKI